MRLCKRLEGICSGTPPRCSEEQEASGTFSDRAVAPAWIVAFSGRPQLGLTVPLRTTYFQSYRACN